MKIGLDTALFTERWHVIWAQSRSIPANGCSDHKMCNGKDALFQKAGD
jgi:hypothetical protein